MEHDWNGVEGTPDWNSDVVFARRLVTLTDNADIVHVRLTVFDGHLIPHLIRKLMRFLLFI